MKANSPIALVSSEQLKLCRIGQGAACCRYLVCGGRGFECEKHGELRATLDQRAAAGQMVARGDNCEGIEPGFPAS